MLPIDSAKYLVPGAGMLFVAVAAVGLWRWRASCRFRWFWAGAGIWLAGVAPKLVFDALTLDTVLEILERSVAPIAYPAVAATWIGIQSSVFEIGVTLLAALVWRRLAARGADAVAVGVGAGAFEAALLGLASLVGVVAILARVPGTEQGRVVLAESAAVTPLAWLVAPIERVLAIAGHTGARTLVLWSVAGRRWLGVAAGFALFAAMDAVAGYAHVNPTMATTSMWWVELAILPTAIIGGVVVAFCFTRWPPTPGRM